MKRWIRPVGLVVGLAVLIALLVMQPLQEIVAAGSRVGWRAIGVLAFTPTWYATNTTALWLLVGHGVPWWALFFNRVVGDGLNTLLPLASVGGEPWKARHLSRLLGNEEPAAPVLEPESSRVGSVRSPPTAPAGRRGSAHTATTAVIADRLVEEVSGALFAGGCLVTSGAALAWPAWMRIGSTALGGCLLATGIISCLALVGRTPSRVAGFILRALGHPEAAAAPLNTRALAAALALHLIGRGVGALEVGFLLYALGVPTDVHAVAGVAGVLLVAGVAAVVVPQGLGAFEAASVLALGMLGQPTAVGVAFGLLRRGRIIFYGALGGAIGLWDARRRDPRRRR